MKDPTSFIPKEPETQEVKGENSDGTGIQMKKGTEDAQQEEVIILNTKKPRFQVLSPEALAIVKEKCQQAIKNNQLSVLPADAEVQQAFDTLRADYLNEELPLPERAITNITITDDEFRESSKIITDKILQLICAEDRAENLIGLYIWRAGIVPFMASCIDAGIQKHEHIGMNRVENNPTQQEIYLPLTVDAKILSKNSKILLADPMFATGGSLINVIAQLLQEGIKEEQIILATVISAPEGVAKILDKYPDIKIYTGSLDDHLNEDAFIQDGLGDFGDKGTANITEEYFDKLRPYLTEENYQKMLEKFKAIPRKKQEIS